MHLFFHVIYFSLRSRSIHVEFQSPFPHFARAPVDVLVVFVEVGCVYAQGQELCLASHSSFCSVLVWDRLSLLWTKLFCYARRAHIRVSLIFCQAVHIYLLDRSTSSTQRDTLSRIIGPTMLFGAVKPISSTRDALRCDHSSHMKNVCSASASTVWGRGSAHPAAIRLEAPVAGIVLLTERYYSCCRHSLYNNHNYVVHTLCKVFDK